jgi:hypothetical protein
MVLILILKNVAGSLPHSARQMEDGASITTRRCASRRLGMNVERRVPMNDIAAEKKKDLAREG